MEGAPSVIKSHEIENEACVTNIAKHSRKILISIRDPRDSVTSLMLAHRYDFDRALNLVEQSAALCADFARDRRAMIFQYESDFVASADTVAAISKHLGIQLDESTAQSIFSSLTRAMVEKYIKEMPKLKSLLREKVSGDLLDTQTQWHSHHGGRDGAIGKWQSHLTKKQASEVYQRIDQSMKICTANLKKMSPNSAVFLSSTFSTSA